MPCLQSSPGNELHQNEAFQVNTVFKTVKCGFSRVILFSVLIPFIQYGTLKNSIIMTFSKRIAIGLLFDS
jgi:hypothetical protein